MKSVELDEVSKVYGRTFAIHRVSARFEAGTATVLVGENGAGKTTLLNLLATLDEPTSGTIRYGGQPFADFARTARNRVGWVSHDSLVYDDLTGTENLVFYARMYRCPNPRQLAADWLKRVGLDDVGGRRVSAYSRGMRQRLSVARALLHEPDLVLLDEPLTGLDQGGRERLIEVFTAVRNRGAIVVMITHDLHVGGELVNQVAVLKQGKLTFVGDATVLEAFSEHG